ncbi:Cytochrome b5-like Heme/Steroid binding domain-containing protein [Geodermatophilus africanus]|uniref:Cytochrome b5-like Heme/Steroid binding domain-containing protein n=1 Tax=Geodermatophilus africanus TaxID=1137993 RepID=A0A1H3AL87_9ACTN|nr:cytochrome b5-like heme/steroid binding domain-containing protein [Geodermatophilus africanus]SDX30201.1 Cytochrome b5-like Heme/Steroid binding domain-containing protein [Geodermatophilus africanus]
MRPLRTPPAARGLAPAAAGRHPVGALLPGGRAERGHGLAELAEHNDDEHGWWLALDGRVHDVTAFVRGHPAETVLRASAGLDATTAADRALLDTPGLRQLLAATDAGPLVRPALGRAQGLHDAWAGALSGLVSLQNAFRLDRISAGCTDPCPADGDLPSARQAERTAARFGDEHLPRFAAEVLAPLAERVLREQRATALRIRTVAGGPGGGLLPGCSPRRRLDLLDRRIGATKALLTRGVRCFDIWGDAVLGTGDLWRLAAQAVPVCAGAATLSVHTTRRAG